MSINTELDEQGKGDLLQPDQYAVFGNPIAHSQSPVIHADFARQTQQQLEYTKQLVDIDHFPQAVDTFVARGGKGLNITVPFKQEAYQKAHRLSKRARQAGAVNTLIIHEDGSIEGDNTDGVGLVNDIKDNLGWAVSGKTVLLLGAGGAARGVLGPLLAEAPTKVLIANRTLEKAAHLAQAFGKQGSIESVSFERLPLQPVDLIINATSASLSGDLPPIPDAVVGEQTACYDMMYSKELTPFLVWAEAMGSNKGADGLGMLVEQAAEAFYQWRAVRPDTKPLINKLR